MFPSMLIRLPIAFRSPPTLLTGGTEASGVPLWVWGVGVVVVVLALVGVWRIIPQRGSASQRAAEKLYKSGGVDTKTRRALERAASQLELKSPAGLLISATALAEAVQRCESLKESEKDRLRKLAIKIAQENTQ